MMPVCNACCAIVTLLKALYIQYIREYAGLVCLSQSYLVDEDM